MNILAQHWRIVLLGLFVAFIAVTIKALLGRWGSLGNFLYNFLYLGILFVVGLIFGPEIFVKDLFHEVCTLILYPICFYVTGQILTRTGLRRQYY